MVKSDTLNETHHFRRVIRLKKGSLILETKKYDDPKGGRSRYKFNVDTLALFWQAGEPVEYLMAYGTAVDNKKLNCRRRYEPNKIPAEVMAFIGDELKGLQ